MKKRSKITINIMKRLLQNKTLTIRELKLNNKEYKEFTKDLSLYGGFNSTRDVNGKIDTIWLSNAGKDFILRYIEKRNYLKHVFMFLKKHLFELFSFTIKEF